MAWKGIVPRSYRGSPVSLSAAASRLPAGFGFALGRVAGDGLGFSGRWLMQAVFTPSVGVLFA